MKKLNLIATGVTTLLLFTANLNAQTQNDRVSRFGVKAGYSHASIAQSSKKNVWNNDSDARSGFYGGLFAELSLTPEKGFAIQVEALYSQQGDSYKTQLTPNNTLTTDLELDYINVPVLAKVYVTNWLALYGGPTVGFKVNEKTQISSTDSNYTIGRTDDNVQDIDVSLTGGITFDISNRFFIEGRYNHGIKPLVRGAGNNNNNSFIQAGVGFKF